MINSHYEDPEHVAAEIAAGRHRELIGGAWDEIGQLQFAFLRQAGLQPSHRLIDVGCGSFRAGVQLIPYLDPGHYYGLDISQQLIDAGYEREIAAAGLAARFPRSNTTVNSAFDIGGFGQMFDFGIAQSVFSHLPIPYLPQCLTRIAPHFRRGGRFFATYFRAPDGAEDQPYRQSPGVQTYPDRDLYHYSVRQVVEAVQALPAWDLQVIGNWNHPRFQQMLAFRRT